MADNTIIQQGRFTSDGADSIINLRSDLDWMTVYNYTVMNAQSENSFQFQWFRGLPNQSLGTALIWSMDGSQLVTASTDVGMFYLQDSSVQAPGASVAVTATSDATQPIVDTGSTTGLSAGSIVRLINIANRPNLGGYDFQIDTIVTDTSFRIAATLANAPGAGGAGAYRVIPFDPIFYPRRRFVVNISQASEAQVTTSVAHGYTQGQQVRMVVPELTVAPGMTQMDGLTATITSVVDQFNFTISVDSTTFNAFKFPVAGDYPFTPSEVIPMGEDTAEALANGLDILADATNNVSYIGMKLVGGADFPGGDDGDVMFWVAGKSFSVDLD
jgi:hypothetical protein